MTLVAGAVGLLVKQEPGQPVWLIPFILCMFFYLVLAVYTAEAIIEVTPSGALT